MYKVSFVPVKWLIAFFFFPSILELPENWTDTRETLLEGMLFQVKYLGMTLVEQPKGEELSAAAVKRIVATVRVVFPNISISNKCTFCPPVLAVHER